MRGLGGRGGETRNRNSRDTATMRRDRRPSVLVCLTQGVGRVGSFRGP